LKVFLLKSEIRTECQLSPLQFNIILEVLAKVITPEEEIMSVQTDKEDSKLSWFADCMLLHIENVAESMLKNLVGTELGL
jgi:hypothetical protein